MALHFSGIIHVSIAFIAFADIIANDKTIAIHTKKLTIQIGFGDVIAIASTLQRLHQTFFLVYHLISSTI